MAFVAASSTTSVCAEAAEPDRPAPELEHAPPADARLLCDAKQHRTGPRSSKLAVALSLGRCVKSAAVWKAIAEKLSGGRGVELI